MFKKKNDVFLDLQQSDEVLQSILEDCELEPNSVPLETLLSYSNYRKERFAFQKRTLLFILCLFILLPFLFLPLNIEVEQAGTNTYLLKTNEMVPLLSISAKVDGTKQIISTSKKDVYHIVPSTNGSLDIVVTQWNLQRQSISIPISGLDTEAPKILSQRLLKEENLICIEVEDNQSGIDYEHVYAKTKDGELIYPESYEEGAIFFEYGYDYSDFYITDYSGNVLHLK